MPDPFPPAQWAEIEKYEAQIARITELRKGPPKPWYESTTWVGSVTAIVTLVLTAVLGYLSQTSLAGREQRLSRQTAHAAAMREAMINAIELLGAMFKANEERLLLMKGKLDALPHSEQVAISRNTNAIQERWRGDRDRVGLLLYISAGPKADSEWSAMSVQLERYTKCVEDAYYAYQGRVAQDTICVATKAGADDAMRTLRTFLRDRLLAVLGPE